MIDFEFMERPLKIAWIRRIIEGDNTSWKIILNYAVRQFDGVDFLINNIQATISALWLAEHMSINPKLVNSAISPVQKSEIECKTVKLSAKLWN